MSLTAEEYRARAEQVRKQAETELDDEVRQKLLVVIESYEKLAALAEKEAER
jgi:hypothetical protein